MGEITNEMKEVEPAATDRIQEEIRQTESEISHTLTSIEERFTPKHIKQELTEMLKHYAVVGAVKVSDACKQRPVPAMLIGSTAALLLVRRLVTRRHHKNRHLMSRAAAMTDALPKKVKKEPVKTVKRYITLGRIAVAAASAMGAFLARQKEAAGTPSLERQGRFGGRQNLEVTVK